MIAIYLRLSSADGDLGTDGKDESNSIENQRAILTDFIRHRDDICGEIREYVDDGYSGTNFDRPAFKQMIEDMKGKMIDVVLTKDLSRLGRNYIDTGDYMERIFPMLGVRYIAVNSNYDSNDHIGDTIGLDMSVMNLVNNLYSRDLSKKVKSAYRTMWKSGKATSGRPTYGYIVDPENKTKWIIDPEPATVVRMIFDMAADGSTVRGIIDELNRKHVMTPGQYREARGHIKRVNRKLPDKEWLWDYSMVRRIIRSYEYTGAMIQGKHSSYIVGRRSSRQIPESEWFVFEDHHEAIISKELFDKANGIIGKTVKSGIVEHDEFALKSVLYCGNCGMRLHHKRSTSKNVYCRHKQRTGEYSSCSDAVYPVDRIKSIVSRALYNQIKLMRELSDELELKKQKLPDNSNYVRRISSKISALNTEKTELYEAYADDRVSRADYISRRDQIRTEVEQLQKAKNDLTADADALNDLQGSADQYAVLADQIDFAKGLTREQVDAFIERVNIYNEDNYEIIFKFDDLLKRIIREVETES